MKLVEQTATLLRFEDQQEAGHALAFGLTLFTLYALWFAIKNRRDGWLNGRTVGVAVLLVGIGLSLWLGTTHTMVTLDLPANKARVVQTSALGTTSRDEAMSLSPRPEVKLSANCLAGTRGRPWERVTLVRGAEELVLADCDADFDQNQAMLTAITALLK